MRVNFLMYFVCFLSSRRLQTRCALVTGVQTCALPICVDPHYWLAAPNAKAIARTVGAELARLAPDRRADIDDALAAYLVRLDAADTEVRRLLADLHDRNSVA